MGHPGRRDGPGEQPAEAIVREVLEETGVNFAVDRVADRPEAWFAPIGQTDAFALGA